VSSKQRIDVAWTVVPCANAKPLEFAESSASQSETGDAVLHDFRNPI